MKYNFLLYIFFFISFFVNANSKTDLGSLLTDKPKGFVENKGQIINQNNQPNMDVNFLWNGQGMNIQLRKTGFSYDVWKNVENPVQASENNNLTNDNAAKHLLNNTVYFHRIDIDFENANANFTISTDDEWADFINYYTTGTIENTLTTANHFGKIVYQNVWNGIDIEFILIDGKPKYNFILGAHAKISDIKLKINGADEIIEKDGQLILKNSINDITESVPNSFYISNGSQQNVNVSFKKNTDDSYGFSVEGKIPIGSTLTIDPVPNIVWGTYFGGSSDEISYAICSDATGNSTIAGYTTSTTNIASSGAYQTTYGGGSADIFIAKFDLTGLRLWSTFYGGSGDDQAFGIVSDRNNNVIIIGTSASSTGMGTSGAIYQPAYGGGSLDAIIAKFNSSGQIQWATYFGGTSTDWGYGIACDTNNNIFVTGYTSSASAIASAGAYQTAYAGGGNDVFIAKFSSLGSKLWGTYYGGSASDVGKGITTDTIGNIYVTGNTNSSASIASSGAYKTSFGGSNDAFLVKFNTTGTRQWGTYYGGTGDDFGYAVKCDKNANIIFSGNTGSSSSGISSSGADQATYGGGSTDGFIVKFSPICSLIWGTYFGGNLNDNAAAITTDDNSNIYITGSTTSVAGIATSGVYQSSFGSSSTSLNDACIAKFDSSGVRLWSSYYGGLSGDLGLGITYDGIGNIAITGYTNSSSTISTSGTYQSSYAGAGASGLGDGFVSKFSVCPPASSIIAGSNSPICAGVNLNLTASGGSTYSWTGPNGFVSSSQNPIITNPTAANSGTYTVVVSAVGCQFTKQVVVVVSANAKPNAGFTQNYFSNCLSGNSFLLHDTSTISVGSYNRLWSFSNGDTSTSNSFNKTFITPGTYTVKLLVSSGGVCSDSVTKTLTVYPQTNVGFTINNANQCLVGNQFVYTDTSTISLGTYSRTWSLGDASTAATGIVNKSYPSINTYHIKLVTTSNNGCLDSVQHDAIVNVAPIIGFTQNNFAQCLSGNQFSYTDTSSISSGTITRLWKFSNGDTSTSASFNKTFLSAGIYTLTLIITTNNSCKDSISKTFTVYPQTAVGFTTNNSTQCYTGNVFVYTDTSTISSGTYTKLWSLGDGSLANSTIVNKSYNTTGNFLIKIVTTTNNGCIDSIQKNVTINVVPVVGYTQNNFAQCFTGNQFSFSDTSSISAGTITRLWKFSNGDTSTSASFNKTFIQSGIYTLTLIITANNNCKDSVVKTFTVYPKTNVGFVINSTNQCFTGNNYIFTDTSTGAAYTRLWHLGDGALANSTVVNKSYSSSGSYTITLVATTISNGCVDSTQQVISVNPFVQPNVGFTQNTFTNCLTGNAFILNDTSTISSGTITRIWKFSNGDTSTANNLSKSFLTAGNYTIKLIEISNNNCKDSITKTITVYPQTTIGFNINNLNQCYNGNNFVLEDTTVLSVGSFSRVWNFGDATSSQSPSVNKSYLVDGTYTINLVTTTNSGCIDSIQKVVTVKPQPKAGYTQNSFTHCLAGNNFLLTDTSSSSSGTFVKNWVFSDGDTSTANSINKIFLTAGTFTAKLIATSVSGCKDSAIKNITVYPQTTIGFSINNNNQCIVGNNVILIDTSLVVGGSFTRLWRLGDNTTSTSIVLNKSYSSKGTYLVNLITTTNNGCIDSVQKNITINAQPKAGFLQDIFSHCLAGNAFNLWDTSSISSGTMQRLWSFSNGDTATADTINKIFTTAGVYTVKLIEVSNQNCKDSATKTLTVYPQTQIGFSVNNTTQCLNSNNFLLTDTSTISSGTYARIWDLGDGSTGITSSITKKYLSEGVYFLKLTTTSNNGCVDSSKKTVFIYPQPKAGFTQNSFAQCLSGNKFIFNDTSTASSGSFTRNWIFGNGDTSTSISPNKTFFTAGIMSTKLLVTSASGCSDSVTKNITVYPQTTIGFYQNNLQQCIRNNNFVLFDTSTISTGFYTRLWSFGDSTFSTNSFINKSFSKEGSYSLMLYTKSNNGCIDSLQKTVLINAQPTIGFAQNNFAQCLTGNTFILNDTSSISIGSINRLWKFSDGDTSTSNLVNKTFLNSGTFTGKLIVSSDNNCGDSVSKSFTIYPQTHIAFTIPTSRNQCLTGNSFIYQDASYSLAGNISRIWDLGDSSTSSSNYIVKSYDSATIYTVRLVTLTSDGCLDTLQKLVTVNPQPNVGFSENTTAHCLLGNNFILADTSSIISGTFTKSWSFSDGDTSTADTVVKNFIASNNYVAKLVITSNNGCKDSVSKKLTVYPQPHMGFSQNSLTQCFAANSFKFKDTSVILGTSTSIWDYGDSTTDSANSVTKHYTSTGNYTIKLITISDHNCSDSLFKTVSVFTQPKAGFIQNNLAQCLVGNNFILTDTSTLSSGLFSRIWTFGDSTSSIQSTNNKSYLNSGLYQIKLLVTDSNFCNDSVTKTVNVYKKPKAGFSTNNLVQCFSNNNFVFNDTSSNIGSGHKSLWYFGDSTNADTTPIINKTYKDIGYYTVSLKVVDINNCFDSVSNIITVKVSPAKPIITVISKSELQSTQAKNYTWILNNNIILQDTITQTLDLFSNGTYKVKITGSNGCSSTSDSVNMINVQDVPNSGNIFIYPNPSTDKFTIDFNGMDGDKHFEIYNLSSELINDFTVTDKALDIELGGYTKGMYYIRITSNAGVFLKKVLVY